MSNEVTIVESYTDYTTEILQEDIDRLSRENESLQSEVKRLRGEKSHLMEQLTLIKSFSDGLWIQLKNNHHL